VTPSDAPTEGPTSRAELLRADLESLGLVLLAVSSHRTDPDLFTVYLHGAAAQWVGGEAVRLAASIPGVTEVVESGQSPAILRVRIQHPGEAGQSSGQPHGERRGGGERSSSADGG